MRVKICGITNREDALAAVEAGAHALGFVFAPSPRQVTPGAAAEIIAALPPFVQTVGVVVDQEIAPILARCPLDVIQFHGDEAPEALAEVSGVRRIKAFRVADEADLEPLSAYAGVADAFLLDARVPGVAGGTGQTFPWHLAREARRHGRPIVLAGGLTPENVHAAIAAGCPDAVDGSSQVELAPGRKDHVRVRRFIAAALAAPRPHPGSAGILPACRSGQHEGTRDSVAANQPPVRLPECGLQSAVAEAQPAENSGLKSALRQSREDVA